MKHWLHRLQRLPRPHCVTDIHQNTMKTSEPDVTHETNISIITCVTNTHKHTMETRATGITHATNVPMITNHTQTFMIHTHKQ